MKAYNLAMGFILINCGFALLGSMGDVFFEASAHSGGLDFLTTLLTVDLVTIGGFSFTGMHAFTALLLAGSFLVLNSKLGPESKGYAYVAFTVVFWGGFVSTYTIIDSIDVPGMSVISTLVFLIATLVFVMTLIQMPTGGQKSYV